MSSLEWFLSGIFVAGYLTCMIMLVIVSFVNGHWILGTLGIFVPVLWLVGAILLPTTESVIEE